MDIVESPESESSKGVGAIGNIKDIQEQISHWAEYIEIFSLIFFLAIFVYQFIKRSREYASKFKIT